MAVTSFTVLAGGSLAEGFLAYSTDSLSSITKHAFAETSCDDAEKDKAGGTAASRRTTPSRKRIDRFKSAPEIAKMDYQKNGIPASHQPCNGRRISGLA
jgi:hypothetical protein